MIKNEPLKYGPIANGGYFTKKLCPAASVYEIVSHSFMFTNGWKGQP